METEREGWARLGLSIKFPGLAGKESCLASEYAAGSTLDVVSTPLASFRAMTICQRPYSHGSHEVALQSLLASREKYWVGSFILSVNLDHGHCNFPWLQTASKDPTDVLLYMSSGLGFRLKSCCEPGRREVCGKEEMRTEGKGTARANSRMEKWRYTWNLSLPEMQNRKLLTWHRTWNRATQNTISRFGAWSE